MATPWMGAGTGIGIGKETIWGTAVAADKWFPLVTVAGGRRIQRDATPHLIVGGAGGRRDYFSVRESAEGSFTVLARYTGLGYLLEACMGAVATTGASSPYTHTHTLSGALPALTLRVCRGSSGSDQLIEGAKVNGWALSVAAGELMKLRLDYIAQTAQARADITAGTYETGEIIAHQHAGVLGFNSQTYAAQSIEISQSNQVARVDELGSLMTSEPAVATNLRESKFKVTLVSRSDTLLTEHLAGTQGDATITFTGGTSPNATLFTLKNAVVTAFDDPISSQNFWTQTVELTGHADSSNEGLIVAQTNGQANYYD